MQQCPTLSVPARTSQLWHIHRVDRSHLPFRVQPMHTVEIFPMPMLPRALQKPATQARSDAVQGAPAQMSDHGSLSAAASVLEDTTEALSLDVIATHAHPQHAVSQPAAATAGANIFQRLSQQADERKVRLVDLFRMVDKQGHGWLSEAELFRFCCLVVPDISPGQLRYLQVQPLE
jgi:hypothetical protein